MILALVNTLRRAVRLLRHDGACLLLCLLFLKCLAFTESTLRDDLVGDGAGNIG